MNMKNISIYLISAVVFLAAFSGCTENVNYADAKVTPVKELYAPAEGAYTKLIGLNGSVLRFAWDAAAAEDGMPVFYQVVFFKSQGGEVVHAVDAGTQTSIEISHKQINRAAGLAEVGSGEEGTIYWSVTANRGINQTFAAAGPRSLTVKRLTGFADIPDELYLSGTGTEAGDNVADAMKCRLAQDEEDGVFEVITRFTSGDYRFLTSTGVDAKSYAVVAGMLEETANAAATPMTDGSICRITVDFYTRGFTVEKIKRVEYNYARDNAYTQEMPYEGKGVWALDDKEVVFKSGDERYNFWAFFEDGGNEIREIWGSENFDNSGRGPAAGAGDYNNIRVTPWGGNDFEYTFKFNSAFDSRLVDIRLIMTGEGEAYTHTLTDAGEIE